jgi:hypothetical protein
MSPRSLHRTLATASLVLGAGAFAAGAQDRSGSGLRTEFSDVHLPSLAIGKTYSTWHMAEAPLVVRNTSDDTLRVHLDVAVPARHDVRSGALPVPDRHWVQFDNTDFVLPPHFSASTDVRLSLPYDPDLAGHTYQVDLWSRNVGRGGVQYDSGQRHPLLFTVAMDYRDDTEIDCASLSFVPGGGAR